MSEDAPADVYQQDPHAAPDGDYEPGTLAHLAAGSRGRMLDPRRTPVTVLGVDDATAMFELVLEAFEERGARWRLPVEDVGGFQFEPGGPRLTPPRQDELRQLAGRFGGSLELPAEAGAREQTLRELAGERERIAATLAGTPELAEIDLSDSVARREGSPAAAAALQRLLTEAGLGDLDAAFAKTYVSNPGSGETVKGHAIVLAEMGLCPYAGPVVRDPALFTAAGAKRARRGHILLRLAFLAELMALLGVAEVELFRGIAVDGPLEPQRARSFVAATFSRAVAGAHFETPTEVALLARQRVPVGRLFMTFLETAAMNRSYREAEAVLLGAPGNLAF